MMPEWVPGMDPRVVLKMIAGVTWDTSESAAQCAYWMRDAALKASEDLSMYPQRVSLREAGGHRRGGPELPRWVEDDGIAGYEPAGPCVPLK